VIGKCAVGSGLHIAKVQKANLHALQFFNKVVEMLEHDADLVLAALNEADFVPGVIAFANEFQAGWSGFATVHWDARAKEFFFFVSEGAFDLGEVGFGNVAGGRGEGVGEITVVGEKQQAFTEVIEPAHRIDALAHAFEKLHDRFAAFRIKDSGNDVLGFVERVVREMFWSAEDVAVYFDLVCCEVGFGTEFGDGLAVDGDVAGDD
jgi:hypothetical protein